MVERLMTFQQRVRKDTVIIQGYGQTESGGAVLEPSPDGPFGNLGEPKPEFEVKVS